MPPTHAVIIPHYNDVERLARCLAAVFSEDVTGVEILVVDNGSTQPLDPVRENFPMVVFVAEPNKGAALARNRGVSESTAAGLIFLDADCLPVPGWLTAAKRASDGADIVGGAIDVFDETPPPRTGAQAFETVFAFNYKDYIERKRFSVTANLVTTRDVFTAVGDFIDGVSEDAEWCQRATAKGFTLTLDETMRVGHPTRSDWGALERKWRRIAQEMYQLHRAGHAGWAGNALWFLRALVMLASIPVHIPKLLGSAKLNGMAERLKGIATLVHLRVLRSWWMIRQALGRPV
ncbi:MAG: glycosyltransferase family 2 protein [Albidovulum sp.]